MAKKKKKGKNLPSKEVTKILNTGFGVLNPVYDTLTSKNFDSSDTSWFDLARETVVRTFQPNTLTGTGPYIGIVLRDEGATNVKIEDKKSWAAAAYSHRTKDEETGAIRPDKIHQMPQLRQLRVRIPELHASLPIPERLPFRSQNKDEADRKAHRVINMYPVFVAQNTFISATEINPATLVWVDFQNRNTMQGGIFLSIIETKQTMEDIGKGEKDVTSKDPYQACLDNGGTSETCAHYNEGGVIYQSGGSTSNLTIRRAEPVIKQGSGFLYDFVTVIKADETPADAKKRLESLRKQSNYSTYLSHVRGSSKLAQYRPSFWSYGAALPNQLIRFSGSKMHRLAEPRMIAMQNMWQQYLRKVIGSAMGAKVLEPTKDQINSVPGLSLFAGASKTETSTAPLTLDTRIPTKGEDKPIQIRSYTAVLGLNSSFRDGSKFKLNARSIKKWINSATPKSPAGKIDFTNLGYPGIGNHAAALAIDFGSNGLSPTGATDSGYKKSNKTDQFWAPQYTSQLYIFLLKYGWLFGIYPFAAAGEAWHWEIQPPRQAWKQVEEYASGAEDYNSFYEFAYPGDYKIINSKDLVTDTTLIRDETLRNIYSTELYLMGYYIPQYKTADGTVESEKKFDFPYAVNCIEESKQNSGTLSRSSKNLTSAKLIKEFLKANGLESEIKFSGGGNILDLPPAKLEKIQNADNDPNLEGKIQWFATTE